MLINLYVKNFAIIKEINIDFVKGLNILSGETGSGKSLLLKAISILKGDRFNKDYIGVFGDKTIIEAIFTSNDRINQILEDNDIDVDSNIVLSRTFTENSSITKINNRACNMKFLGEIASMIFDIHGQHSNLIVLNKSNYINLIDKFNDETDEYKTKLSNNLRQLQILKKENEALNMSDDEIEREKDLLLYQINEIESFDFDNYDEESLNKEYKKLANQSELINGTDSIINFMSESGRIPSMKEMSHILYDNLVDLENLDDD
ncbi:MAG: AAA family ATPase, partial [Helcococcus sp.]|nr:AAA family ATPase [Helcococcus sp.]